jgi:hypothetical protein
MPETEMKREIGSLERVCVDVRRLGDDVVLEVADVQVFLTPTEAKQLIELLRTAARGKKCGCGLYGTIPPCTDEGCGCEICQDCRKNP